MNKKVIENLDLSFKGTLRNDVRTTFCSISDELRGPFTQLVNNVSEPLKSNLDWWVESTSSRNSLASPLYHYYCCFHFFDYLVNERIKISEIKVDSRALKKLLQCYCKLHSLDYKVDVTGKTQSSRLKKLLSACMLIYNVGKEEYYKLLCAKKTKYLSEDLPKKPLTLIDTFIIPGFINKDRYYEGLWQNLTEKQRETTFFVSTLALIPLNDYEKTFKLLRTNPRKFLIKEDYLSLSDIFYSLFHCIRIFFIKINPIFVFNVDFSPLIREEIFSMRGYVNAFESLLNYRFARKLKKKGVNIRLVVDWFENQVIDKGWNIGFNKFYPETMTKGYRGIVPAYQYLSQWSPTIVEMEGGVLPKQINVIGKKFVEPSKEFAHNINVSVAPAFRFQYLWNDNTNNVESNNYNILVALSIILSESLNILQLLHDTINDGYLNDYKILIKPHPTMEIETIKRGFRRKWPSEFKIVDGEAKDYLKKCSLLISGMSSICLESMALAIPVVVCENPSGLSYNTIPLDVPNELWRSCKTIDEIIQAIEYFENRSTQTIRKHQKLCNQIKKDYFEPVTKESVYRFLELEG